MSLLPSNLTTDVHGLLSSVSRHEIVNLYVQTQIQQVTAEKVRIHRKVADLQKIQSDWTGAFYAEVRKTVMKQAGVVAKSLGDTLKKCGVMTGKPRLPDMPTERKVRVEPFYVSSDGNRGSENGWYLVQAVVAYLGAASGEIHKTGRKLEPSLASFRVPIYLPSPKEGEEDVVRIYIMVDVPLDVPEEVQAAVLEARRLLEKVSSLEKRIADIPAMERAALAELTRKTLADQGVNLDIPLLLSTDALE